MSNDPGLGRTVIALEELLVGEIIGERSFHKFKDGKLSKEELSPFIPRILELSRSYINKKGKQPISIDRLSAESYALYYLPINFVKIKELLGNCDLQSLKRATTILDFGSGPGTSVLALLSEGLSPRSITLVDRSSEMLKLAERLIKRSGWIGDQTSLSYVIGESAKFNEKFDLIIVSNVLNEIGEPKDLSMLLSLAGYLNQDGHLIVLEPALKNSTRRTMQIRDDLLNKFEGLSPLYPCLHKDRCQMLSQSETDWCHGEIRWEEPLILKQIDRLTGFNKHRIKYSGFVFQNKKIKTTGYRVVSIPSKTKRGVEMLVCGSDYYGRILVKKSDKSEKAAQLKGCRLYSDFNIGKDFLRRSD